VAAFEYHENALPKWSCPHAISYLTRRFATDVNAVLGFAFASAGLDCAVMDVGVTVLETSPDVAQAIMAQIAVSPPDIGSVSEFVENLQSAKFDEMVPVTLLRRVWVRGRQGVADGMTNVVREIVRGNR
jgi:ATP-dependent Lhr-like helicase